MSKPKMTINNEQISFADRFYHSKYFDIGFGDRKKEKKKIQMKPK